MNQRGQAGGNVIAYVVWVLLIFTILAVVVVGYLQPALGVSFENAPQAVESTINTLSKVFSPIVNGLFFVVAPQGQDDNVQMIAFALFLLVTLVGNKTLAPFIQGPFMAFFISGIVGLIVARSLTATILEQSALAASPLAAVSLLIGFFPVYAITKNLDKWGWVRQVWSKMVIFTVVAAVYFFFFTILLKALFLGVTYAAGIVLLGATEMLGPLWSEHRKKAGDLEVGRVMGALHEDEQTARAIVQGRAQAIDPRTGRPRNP